MLAEVLLVCAVALPLSAVVTGVVRKAALSHGVLDVPNERSSHTRATPRGGGASIVLVVSVGLAMLTALGRIRGGLAAALLVGGVAVAGVGFIDDRSSVPAHIRLAVHLMAALFATACLGGFPYVWVGDRLVHLGAWGYLLAPLGIVWALNLFNFMDGIDGIAGSEAVFVLVTAGIWAALGDGTTEVSAAALLIGASSIGFLFWNWPPARIFMGDVGSGYLGYAIGVLTLATAHASRAGLWIWLILGGGFLADSTVTLVRRIGRGDRVYEAHRSHAYQWLARCWGSHKKVTVALIALNLIWLLPCCCFAALNPSLAAWTALTALAPVALGALAAGAGRKEKS
jgi:Fuc2NAc and GlcNAc transferase